MYVSHIQLSNEGGVGGGAGGGRASVCAGMRCMRDTFAFVTLYSNRVHAFQAVSLYMQRSQVFYTLMLPYYSTLPKALRY